MTYHILFTPEAEETFDALSTQLSERWGDPFVQKLENRLEKALATIVRTPFLYPVTMESTQVRKCILHKNCSMLYKVYNKTILIVCFWDNRQDPLFTG